MPATAELESLLIWIVQSLVVHPERVKIALNEGEDSVLYVSVHPDGVRSVIGRKGIAARRFGYLHPLLGSKRDEEYLSGLGIEPQNYTQK